MTLSSRVARRLFFAAVVLIALSVLCWKVLPGLGVTIPWWVPVTGFLVIVISVLLSPRGDDDQPDGDPDAPIPVRPVEEDGEGVSAADRERFG